MSHVSHLAPSLVVSVGSVWIASVVSALAVEFGVVGMVNIVLDFALQGTHMLSVNLEGKRPECTFPNHTCLCVLDSKVVLVVARLRTHSKVEVIDVEPETHHECTTNNRPDLEPTL